MTLDLLKLEREWHTANTAWNNTVKGKEWDRLGREVAVLESRFLEFPARDIEDVWTKYRFWRFWQRCDEELDGVCEESKRAAVAFEAALRAVCGDGDGEPLPDGKVAAADSGAPRNTDAELIELDRQWLQLHSLMGKPGLLTDDESDVIYDIRKSVEKKIWATPAQGIDGLLVKARRVVYWAEGSDADKVSLKLLDDVQRLGGVRNDRSIRHDR